MGGRPCHETSRGKEDHMKPTIAGYALAALVTSGAYAQPGIYVTFTGSAKVLNNYSNILPGMPSYGDKLLDSPVA